MLNLFIAILLQNFEEDSIDAEKMEIEDKQESIIAKKKAIYWLHIKKLVYKVSMLCRKRSLAAYKIDEQYQKEELAIINKVTRNPQDRKVKVNIFLKKLFKKKAKNG